MLMFMTEIEKTQFFDGKKVRTVWDEEKQEWFFSIKDVVSILAETSNAKDYIAKMRRRDPELSKGWGQIVHPLSIQTPGGPQKENCASMDGIFRIIQSIPSKKAEPFKQWMAGVASERVNQMIDPERSIDQAVSDYRRLGYSEEWITRRIKTIEIRKGLTDEWKRGGVTKEVDFAFLTDLMSKTWSGFTTREYKKYKGLTKENLRDNMTNIELALNTLAEVATTEYSRQSNPQTMAESKRIAKEGGNVARDARKTMERRLGRSVVSKEKASDYLPPAERIQELPEETEDFE